MQSHLLKKQPDKVDFRWYRCENFVAFLEKVYSRRCQTDCPVELLLYTGNTFLTDDGIVEDLKEQSNSLILKFRKIWFMGEKICGCVIPNEIQLDNARKYKFFVKQEGKPARSTREVFDNKKDAIQRGKEFVKANSGLFPPRNGEAQYLWGVADESE